MKITVYTLAFDEWHNGTGAQVFAKEREAVESLLEMINWPEDKPGDQEVEYTRAEMIDFYFDSDALEKCEDNRDWWELLDDHKDYLDTFTIDEHTLEIPDREALSAINGESRTKREWCATGIAI
jgi:hypothetical protein